MIFHSQHAAGEDFFPETQAFSLTGTENINVSVMIIDNNEVEDMERFSGVLSAIDTLPLLVTLFPMKATANIIDDDCK